MTAVVEPTDVDHGGGGGGGGAGAGVGTKRTLRAQEPKKYDTSLIDDEIEGKITFSVEEKLHDEKFSYELSDFLLELNGSDFDLKYIQENGFNTPILFKEKDGLGLRMPDPNLFSVIDVKSYVGARRIIEVFDCETHQPEQMSVHHWVRYYMSEHKEKTLNVTSLEFSGTGLERIVDCPNIVRESLDWVPLVWPEHLLQEQKDATNTVENMKYPKVRKYVLMSVAGCYTDFHIDFGGTSVWYHVLKGAKVFWLIKPTEKNLKIYEQWILSGGQSDVFFGDLVDECYRIHLISGDTFMIPTGWIHGVYTPDDSLVFGGNFLHSYNIPMQLRCFSIEERTKVPGKLRYPFFMEIHWYMIKKYVDVLERDIDERRMLEFERSGSPDGGAFKLVTDEINNVVREPRKKSTWQCVHLTDYELEGLKLVCERFRNWGYAKGNYPSDLKEDCVELLDRLEELLQHHEEDDQILACQGVNFFQQLKMERSDEQKAPPPISPLNTPLKKPEFPVAYAAKEEKQVKEITEEEKPKYNLKRKAREEITTNGNKSLKQDTKEKVKEKTRVKVKAAPPPPPVKKASVIRRVRCNECEACESENCNECKYCLDMPRNGGEGRLRKSCMARFCQNPQLPNHVECNVCGKNKGESNLVLLECTLCSEIVHRTCLKVRKPYKLSKVNNSWECPKCYSKKPSTDGAADDTDNQPLAKVRKKVLNGHVKVQNLKNLIQLTKIKLNKKPVEISREQNDEDSSDDDEPLSKRRITLTKNKVSIDSPTPIKSPDSSRPPTPVVKLEVIEPTTVIRPAPIASPYLNCDLETGATHPLTKDLWMKVFAFLNQRDVCTCMSVCKPWNQWCLDSSYWYELNVSNKSINPSLLKGTIRRQPSILILTSTNISCKQLEWLLKRLPHLKGLDVSLNTASAVSSLMRITCPPLSYLNLAWCDAVYDRFVVQLLSVVRPLRGSSTTTNGVASAAGNEAAAATGVSRLIFLEKFILTGCDISDETVECILTTLTSLKELDVSHCGRVSAKGFELFLKGTHVCKDTLVKVTCLDCPLLTEEFERNFVGARTGELPQLLRVKK